MKKHPFSKWLLVGAAMAAVVACQSKKPTPPPVKTPPAETAPTEPTCSPTSKEGCEQECREDECDYQEAGEEAMIQPPAGGELNTEKSAATEEAAPVAPASLEAPVDAAVKAPEEPAGLQAPAEATAAAPAEPAPLEAPVEATAVAPEESAPGEGPAADMVGDIPADMLENAEEHVSSSPFEIEESGAEMAVQE